MYNHSSYPYRKKAVLKYPDDITCNNIIESRVKMYFRNGETSKNFDFFAKKFLVKVKRPRAFRSQDCGIMRLTNHINLQQKLKGTKFTSVTA